MIARIWRGTTLKTKADEYFHYMKKTGLKDLASTSGNRGVYALRRDKDSRSEFLIVSLWDSLDAIRRFAGRDIEKPVYYPKDRKYLLKLERKVVHYQVLSGP